MSSTPLILASSSPHRQKLLKDLGLDFTSVSPDVDERSIEEDFQGPLTDLASHLSLKKAEYVFEKNPEACVIGSDQVMIFEGKSYPKPETHDEVIQRLSQLNGKTHELHTGLCVLYKDKKFQTTVVTRLTMHPLDDEEIRTYVNDVKPLGCAGGYKIEEKGALLFSQIETTDHFSIIGLPILSLVSILREWGISRL